MTERSSSPRARDDIDLLGKVAGAEIRLIEKLVADRPLFGTPAAASCSRSSATFEDGTSTEVPPRPTGIPIALAHLRDTAPRLRRQGVYRGRNRAPGSSARNVTSLAITAAAAIRIEAIVSTSACQAVVHLVLYLRLHLHAHDS